MPAVSFDVMDFLSKAGVGIITGVIAAIVTANVALRRFYHEKWWEKKSQSYNELVGNLFELQVFFEDVRRHYRRERQGKVTMFDEDIPWDKGESLRIAIQRQLALAPISLSAKTNDLVKHFFEQSSTKLREMFKEGMPQEEIYDERIKLLQQVINEIAHDAKKELKFR
ncbi:hypothetical protein [Enterobacter sp. V87_3]|uniref:hypothetical protein n=1 Tax=Enterobacter sp. V87_3 TaxID=3044236 RepID=UPI00249E6375|nr:hypothetical protein [Enterobacter sp. V87_3]MDI3424608.1 hypothetical protein [Enterobacter sp. V87_3]HAV1807143.1 hypothetical protein [Enterobacter hormaechei subsp. steigerwaltii]